jgi:hypothetical protein
VGIQVYRKAVGIFTRERDMLEGYFRDRCGGQISGSCKTDTSYTKETVWPAFKQTYITYVQRISEDTHIPIEPVDQLGDWFENAFSAYRLVAYADSNSIRYVEGEAIARSAQALIPAKAAELSMTMLKNAEYSPVEWNSQDRLGEKLKLHNGKYYKRDEENSTGAIEFGKSLDIEKIVLGDLNKDEKKDAAVILYHNTGGSGSVTQVAAVLNNNGQPQHVASRELGDRTEIKSLAIKKGFIVITVDNPRFYPGQKKTVKYKLVGNKLMGPEPFH